MPIHQEFKSSMIVGLLNHYHELLVTVCFLLHVGDRYKVLRICCLKCSFI